jgi:hypothetical protein
LRQAIHSHFAAADALRYSCSVGGTHWQALGAARDLPGPKPVLFFAPAQVKLRSGPPLEGWGPQELQRRMAEAWAGFIAQVAGQGWVRIDERPGAQALLAAYEQVLAGQTDARAGVVLSVG